MNSNNYYSHSNLDTKMKREKSKLRSQTDVQMKLSAFKTQLQDISDKLDELILAAIEQYDLLDEKVRSLDAKRSKQQESKRKN